MTLRLVLDTNVWLDWLVFDDPAVAPLAATAETGLKVPSLVRFDKLATLDRQVIAGKIGAAPADWLHAHRAVFFGVFGFGPPQIV